MERITILNLLKKYKAWVEQGDIRFLKENIEGQKEVLDAVKKLLSSFQDATDKQEAETTDGKEQKGLSEFLDSHKIHQEGRDLWQRLASCALKDIDAESKGNSKLFEFHEAATKFEDLLYGMDPYYRDHTLHSLWVYFIGEHIQRDLLTEIFMNPNWYLYNDIEKEKSKYPDLVRDSKSYEEDLCEKVNRYKDAIWCVMALCHDLGYSLAKLERLNERVKAVLEFFELPDFRRIGYSLDIEHQYNVSQFLELMAMDVRIVPSENYEEEEILIKCYRDDSTYWRLCQALEKKQHGILSSYLIYKILSIFADAWVRGPAEKWGLDDDEAIDNIIRGDILYAIAQHSFDFAYLDELSSLADVLSLADELEEFSRYGRQLLSRKYYDTMANARISFKPPNPKQGQDIEIDILYEVNKSEDLDYFFKRKVKRLCELYSLEKKKKEYRFSRIKSIKMTAKYKDKQFFFLLYRGKNPRGFLPVKTFKVLGPNKQEEPLLFPEKEYELVFRDDNLYIDTKDERMPKIPLDKWIPNPTDDLKVSVETPAFAYGEEEVFHSTNS